MEREWRSNEIDWHTHTQTHFLIKYIKNTQNPLIYSEKDVLILEIADEMSYLILTSAKEEINKQTNKQAYDANREKTFEGQDNSELSAARGREFHWIYWQWR